MRFFIDISYDGTNYHGWQIQPNARTVQHQINNALSTILNCNISVVGAGRTDTGVHAKEMMTHFDADLSLETEKNLPYLLNRYLNEEIVIHRLERVKADAHARFDATARTYEYHLGFEKDPFKPQMYYYFHQPVSLEKMNEAAQILLEYKDFEAFAKSHSDVKTFLCDITKAHWDSSAKGAIFTITANRFLRNMVRAIVGTLIEVGTGKIEVADMHKIIQSKNRGEAGFSVPAAGLYLTEIQYPKKIYL